MKSNQNVRKDLREFEKLILKSMWKRMKECKRITVVTPTNEKGREVTQRHQG